MHLAGPSASLLPWRWGSLPASPEGRAGRATQGRAKPRNTVLLVAETRADATACSSASLPTQSLASSTALRLRIDARRPARANDRDVAGLTQDVHECVRPGPAGRTHAFAQEEALQAADADASRATGSQLVGAGFGLRPASGPRMPATGRQRGSVRIAPEFLAADLAPACVH